MKILYHHRTRSKGEQSLQPAVVAYASPWKLFEYLALGKAVVAPAQPNINEILTDGYNAFLFEDGSPQALADAIGRLCAEPDLVQKIGANARKTIVEQQLTWVANARRGVSLFENLESTAPVLNRPLRRGDA